MFAFGATHPYRRIAGWASLIAASLCLSVALPAIADDDFDRLLAESAERDLPVLLKMEADWCEDCAAFDRDMADSLAFSAEVSSKVLLLSVDAEKGKGARLAERYRVNKYPTFVLTDDKGRTMDRWYGYRAPVRFLKQMNSALTDPIPVRDRRARFATDPTEADAAKLAELSLVEGYYGESVAYLNQAEKLGKRAPDYYSEQKMRALIWGAYDRVFDLGQVTETAGTMLENPGITEYDVLRLGSSVAKLAQHLGDTAVAREYIELAVDRTQATEDAKVKKMRKRLLPDYALLVDEDAPAAMRYLEESLPEDWKNDSNQLNNVAWWCFQHHERLDADHIQEAEQLARRGVELARPGNEKANVLDTLAEICNLRGSCGESVDLIREAIAEDPQNQYFHQQLSRFEEILASQGKK